MARTPRASVSMTSGQGVSRLAYQKGYRLRNKDIGGASIHGPGKIDSGSSRGYAKNSKLKSSGDTEQKFNVSYGDTIVPTDVKELGEMFSDKPQKASVSFSPGKPRKLK